MITVSDLLNLNQVRSVLTVSPADLPDSVMLDYGLEDDIGADLDSKLVGWSDLIEESNIRTLRLYVKYRAASIIATTAQVFILKKSTDGSNEGQRSDADGFLWLTRRFAEKADEIMASLLEDLEISVGVTDIELVGRSVPSRDPIVEPREDVS